MQPAGRVPPLSVPTPTVIQRRGGQKGEADPQAPEQHCAENLGEKQEKKKKTLYCERWSDHTLRVVL